MEAGVETWLEVRWELDWCIGVWRRGKKWRALKVVEMETGNGYRVPTLDADLCLSVVCGCTDVMDGDTVGEDDS